MQWQSFGKLVKKLSNFFNLTQKLIKIILIQTYMHLESHKHKVIFQCDYKKFNVKPSRHSTIYIHL